MKRFLAILAISCAAFAAAPKKIVGGPYVVNVTTRSATVVWLVQTDEATLKSTDGETRLSPSLRIEKTTFTGLAPNTRYEYDVSGEESGKGSFKTAPSAAAVPFRFDVYGDVRTRHDVHAKVMEAVVKNGIPDFILHTGDLVADGYDSSLWPIFFGIEREVLRKTAFYPSLGNHERNSPSYFEFLQASPYYSFNWGKAHFICLNSDIASVSPSAAVRNKFWDEQVRWLEEDLAANQTADYRIVFAHHPPFTAVTRRQGDNPHMTALVPLLEKHHVTAAFFGHDHNYQHYLKNGIHYVITGGGGAPLYDVDKPPQDLLQKVASIENFVSVSVANGVMKVEGIAMDGSKLDEFELHADPQKK